MTWDLKETIEYYKHQGAPGEQTAVVSLLREVQRECGGGIPLWALPPIAGSLGIKESYLLAVIKRIPSLRMADTHCLELCAGPNCSKHTGLRVFVEKTYGRSPEKFTVKYVPCMRLCGKGPNIKWDGKLYHKADEPLLRSLIEKV